MSKDVCICGDLSLEIPSLIVIPGSYFSNLLQGKRLTVSIILSLPLINDRNNALHDPGCTAIMSNAFL